MVISIWRKLRRVFTFSPDFVSPFYIDLLHYKMNSKKLKWRSDFDKEVVIDNCIKRGWTKAEKDEDEWNFYWATVWTVRNLFNPKTGIR